MQRFLFHLSHLTAYVLLAAASRRLWHNLRFLRAARGLRALPAASPRVSVLVPARDEIRSIAACVTSLAQQSYPDFEVIVLDDQSTDGTQVVLDDLAARHASLTVLHGTEDPPPGWNGKSYACQRLAERATGEWLLFTDADTLHMPTSIQQGVAQAAGLGVDLLTAFPRQITQTWSEQIAVSFIMDFLPRVAVDLQGLCDGTSGSVVANGQYLLVRAATYRSLGGHAAVADALVDDFALANQFHRGRYRLAAVDGTAMLSCRMYRDAGEVWRGFSKNIWLALETSSVRGPLWLWAPALAWSYACVFVLPFSRLLRPERSPHPVLIVTWLAGLRAAAGRELGRPWSEVLSTPLAAWSVMAFGMSALWRRWRGQRVQWKGRDYRISP